MLVFGFGKLLFHELSLSSAEKTQSAYTQSRKSRERYKPLQKMTSQQFKISFSETVSKTSNHKLRDFALDICMRLKNDYLNFSNITGFGNPQKQESIFSEIQDGKFFTNVEIEKNIGELESICPDTDDFDNIEVSYALNSITSLIDYFNFIKTENQLYIENISRYMLDTLDFKIESTESDISDIELENHPKIIDERIRQLRFISNGL